MNLAVAEANDERPRIETPTPQIGGIEKPEGALSTKEIAADLGVTEKTVGQWVRDGVIEPSVRKSIKQGSAAFWSHEDLALLRILRAVKSLADVTPDVVAMLRLLPAGRVIAVGPNGVRVCARSDSVMSMSRRVGSPVLVLFR